MVYLCEAWCFPFLFFISFLLIFGFFFSSFLFFFLLFGDFCGGGGEKGVTGFHVLDDEGSYLVYTSQGHIQRHATAAGPLQEQHILDSREPRQLLPRLPRKVEDLYAQGIVGLVEEVSQDGVGVFGVEEVGQVRLYVEGLVSEEVQGGLLVFVPHDEMRRSGVLLKVLSPW